MRATLLLFALILSTSSASAAEIRRATLLETINERRQEQGLSPLRLNHSLNLAAEDRMSEMTDLGYWGHVSPEGRQPFVWIRTHGYVYSRAGENLARGFDTAEVLVASWMESEGHRATLLSPDYEDLGLAIMEGSTTGRAGGHSVVALFGSTRLPQ